MGFLIAVKRVWAWFMQPAPAVDLVDDAQWWDEIR